MTPQYAAKSLVAVFLDTGVLGAVTQRAGAKPESDACKQWETDLTAQGVKVFVPEIAAYELRREWILQNNPNALLRLDTFISAATYRFVPMDTPAFDEAARLWADVRKRGVPTASRDALDGDALIAAQVMVWCAINGVSLASVAVATGNVSDMERFTDANGTGLQAATWRNITL